MFKLEKLINISSWYFNDILPIEAIHRIDELSSDTLNRAYILSQISNLNISPISKILGITLHPYYDDLQYVLSFIENCQREFDYDNELWPTQSLNKTI